MFDSALTGYESYYRMLSDRVRMSGFRRAIERLVQPGDQVVDLGAGTGVLGIMALQAGASRVYAVEQSDAIELAREIARVNGVADRMVFIQANSLEVELQEKVDLIVSETLGSFAIDENLLAYLPDARDRLLKPQGRLLPSTIQLFAAPVEAPKSHAKLDFWRQHPGGVDFSPAFELFSRKLMVERIQTRQLLADPIPLDPIDLREWNAPDYRWRGYFNIRKKGLLHGVAGWFEAELAGTCLSTAPDQPPTHWKQAFFPFRDPIRVVPGDVLDWSIEVTGSSSGPDHTCIRYQYRCTQLINEKRSFRIGRNEPCPCGSGRKFKKCCGR